MTYHHMALLVLVAGLLVSWSELLHVSGQKMDDIPKRCQMPLKQGNCGKAIPRYYYDMERKRCQQFIYKGCERSGNSFVSLKNCISKCHLYVEMAQEQYRPGILPIRCIFPKKQGRCKAAFPHYYYNTEKKKCEQFIYGGCGANPNNFQDIEACVKVCECFGEGCKTSVKIEAILADLGK